MLAAIRACSAADCARPPGPQAEFKEMSFLNKQEFFRFLELYADKLERDMQRRFDECDMNGDGTITYDELCRLLQGIGVTPFDQEVAAASRSLRWPTRN